MPTDSAISLSKNQVYYNNDQELIDRIRGRDTKAFAFLYHQYSAALYGNILKIVQREEVAQDVLQETFVKIWKNFDSYDHSRGRLFTWMLNIARNNAIDVTRSKGYKRSRDVLQLQDELKFMNGNGHHSMNNTDRMDAETMINELPPDHKQVIELIYFSGYTHIEAAEKLQLPLGTLKTRVRLAIKHLRKIFR